MSRTSNVELPESARRFHALYRSDLSRVEPVSDAQILAAIDRAEAHDRKQIPDAARWDIAAHLGSYTTHGRRADCARRSTHSRPLAASATFAVSASTWLR